MDRAVVRGLRRSGVDVATVSEAGRERLPDEDQLIFAASQGRVVYSSNVGHFSRIHSMWLRSERHHAGIVLLDKQRTSVGVQIRALLRLREALDAETMRDRLEHVSDWQE